MSDINLHAIIGTYVVENCKLRERINILIQEIEVLKKSRHMLAEKEADGEPNISE